MRQIGVRTKFSSWADTAVEKKHHATQYDKNYTHQILRIKKIKNKNGMYLETKQSGWFENTHIRR